jgi:hypothetical protein
LLDFVIKASVVSKTSARVGTHEVKSVLHYPVIRGTCIGAVVQTGLPCGAPPARLSNSTQVHAWISDAMGPHAFLVAVSKPSVSGGTSVFVRDSCTYVHIVEAHLPGAHDISVVRVLTDYRGLDEMHETVSKFNKDQLPSQSFMCAADSVRKEVVVDNSLASAVVCTTPQPLAWVPVEDVGQQASLARQAFNGAGLRYFPWRAKEMRLSAGACAMCRYSLQPDLAQGRCTRAAGKRAMRVLLTGDSHPRTVFRHFESMAYNRIALLAKGGNLSAPSRSKATETTTTFAAAVHADFWWDPYLESFTTREELLLSYDVVLFGFGMWPASFGQWTYEAYAQRIVEIAAMVRRLQTLAAARQRPVPVLLFAGAPAFPRPRKMPGFRITNARVGAFNSLGRRRLAEVGVPYLDLFAMTHPVPHYHRGDHMHYDHSVVLYSVVDWVLTIACR